MTKITYQDKSYLNQNANIPLVNKVADTDMNEIKSVVNGNDDDYRALINKYRTTITAKPTSNFTLGDTNPNQVLLETSTGYGSLLTLNNYEIVIGEGISKVKVSANILFLTGGVGSSSRRGLMIYKNNNQVIYNNTSSDETYTGCTITPFVLSVQENDTISLYARNQGTANSIVSADNTYLTVEVVD